MPQQAPPPAQAPQPPPKEGDEGGGVQQLVEGIYTGLLKFQEILGGTSPELAQKLEAVTQGFQAIVEALVGGGEGDAQPQQPGPTAGGPGSVPM